MLALMHHIIEQIDGKRFMRLLPHRLATVIKPWIFISFILVFCLFDLTVSLKDAMADAGNIEAAQAITSPNTANDVFDSAVNQTGIVRATGLVNQNGVIKVVSNNNVQASVALKEKGGF